MNVFENGRLWYQLYTDSSKETGNVPIEVDGRVYRVRVEKASYSPNHVHRLPGGGSLCTMRLMFYSHGLFRFTIDLRLSDVKNVIDFGVKPQELLIGDGYTKEDVEHVLTMWQLTREAQ